MADPAVVPAVRFTVALPLASVSAVPPMVPSEVEKVSVSPVTPRPVVASVRVASITARSTPLAEIEDGRAEMASTTPCRGTSWVSVALPTAAWTVAVASVPPASPVRTTVAWPLELVWLTATERDAPAGVAPVRLQVTEAPSTG